MTNGNSEHVTYRVKHFDPDRDQAPRWQEYRIASSAGMTVLEGLWQLKETQAPGLAWRASCRMGVCGSCGMWINGKARLACNTQIAELESSFVTVAPLPNFDIVRDLVPDLTPMFDAHTVVLPFLIRSDRAEQESPTVEYHQSREELERYLQFSYCIKCGCCMAACPTFATDALYSGPMPLTQAQRYNSDSRDDGFGQRKTVLAGTAGPWRCHYAGECSRVCPKGVDPAKAIQLMKRELVLDFLRLRRHSRPTDLVEKPEGIKRRPDIPEAPARTV
ncbi:MAG: succinate dehydrogenase iron-sulfur subunit [Acidobacteriota bacterium]|nr:MAG: succinate dehydrogenase iron-sulfur subunit [Acidobacteriota bacterium]